MKICSANEVSEMTSFSVIFLFSTLMCLHSHNALIRLLADLLSFTGGYIRSLDVKAFVRGTSTKGNYQKILFSSNIPRTNDIFTEREFLHSRIVADHKSPQRRNIIHKLTARRELAKCESRTKATLAINCVEKGIIPSAEAKVAAR